MVKLRAISIVGMLLGIALMPTVAAFPQTEYLEEPVVSIRISGGFFGPTSFTFVKNTAYGYSVIGTKSYLQWDGVFATSGSSVATTRIDLTVYYDGVELVGTACEKIRFERTLGDTFTRLENVNVRCPIPLVIPNTSHTIEVRTVNPLGTSPILVTWQSFSLLQIHEVTNTLEATKAFVKSEFTQTNSYINATNDNINTKHLNLTSFLTVIYNRELTLCQKTGYSQVGCEGMQLTCDMMNCTVSVNNTEVLSEIQSLDTEVGGAIYAFLWLAIVALLAVWAYLDGHYIPYTIAVAGCLFTVIWLPEDGLGGLRILVLATGIGLSVMGWQSYKHKDEDDN